MIVLLGTKYCLHVKEKSMSHWRRRCGYDLGALLARDVMVGSPNTSILLIFAYVKKAISLDPGFTGVFYRGSVFNLTEGFAGSAPLTILEEVLAKDDTPLSATVATLSGRWLAVYRETRDLADTFWQANDADYFICIDDDDEFMKRVGVIIAGLRIAVATHGRTVHVSEPRRNPYADGDRTILIIDVHVSDIDPVISFVQAPSKRRMENVIDDFDFDIVRVIFDPRTQLILTYEPVTESILRGKANLTRSFLVTPGAPTMWEATRISSTLKRMVKYGERGYTFSSYPEIVERSVED